VSAVSLAIYNDQSSRAGEHHSSLVAPEVGTAHKAHPSPLTLQSRTGFKSLFIPGALLSLSLHLIVIISAVAMDFWGDEAVLGTPQEEVLDVSIVPLSALDTLLPKGDASSKLDATKHEAITTDNPEFKTPQRAEISSKTETKNHKPVKKLKIAQERSNLQDASKGVELNSKSSTVPQGFGVSSGDDIAIGQARINYQDMVATLIARAKRYPERALKRGVIGDGSVRIEISSNGSVADIKIVQSTEAPILDEELKAMVDRAAPFPAFPRDLNKSVLAVIVPVSFRIER
jgi:TonB family protein